MSFVIFHYSDGEAQWTTGDGDIYQVGFNAGDGNRFYTIPGLGMDALINNISMTSNIGVPGKWIFQVDGEEIQLPLPVFQFSQPSYNVSEDDGFVTICLELVQGILVDNVTIELNGKTFPGIRQQIW